MIEEEVNMTIREISRANICSEVAQKKISKVDAALALQIGYRQMLRVYKDYQEKGVQGLISKKRGKSSNHQLNSIVKARVKELVTCELYENLNLHLCAKSLKNFMELQ